MVYVNCIEFYLFFYRKSSLSFATEQTFFKASEATDTIAPSTFLYGRLPGISFTASVLPEICFRITQINFIYIFTPTSADDIRNLFRTTCRTKNNLYITHMHFHLSFPIFSSSLPLCSMFYYKEFYFLCSSYFHCFVKESAMELISYYPLQKVSVFPNFFK